MIKRLLKINVRYGISTRPRVVGVHLLDLKRSKVAIYPGYPEFTRYEIFFQCGGQPARTIRFLNKIPRYQKLCPKCQTVRDRLEFYEAEEAKDGYITFPGPAAF